MVSAFYMFLSFWKGRWVRCGSVFAKGSVLRWSGERGGGSRERSKEGKGEHGKDEETVRWRDSQVKAQDVCVG